MIDLHIHSAYSDGTFSVPEILEKAQNAKVMAISITDHNTIEAYHEIKNGRSLYTGQIIKGVEINCIFDGSKIEILGYRFEDDEFLHEWLNAHFSPQQELLFRKREYAKLLAAMKEHGIYNKCSLSYDQNGDLPHTSVYKEIKKYDQNKGRLSEEEWNDFNTFFRTSTTNRSSLLYIDYSDLIPSVDEVSKIIRKAGGMVFLAHVYSYGIKNHIQLIDHLVNRQLLDGVEVYYSKFSAEQTSELYTYCRNHNLLMSGGSDSHGDKGKILNIGTGYGDLNVPDNIVEQWSC